MIGIAIPAHDEEQFIGASVRAAVAAASHPGLKGEEVQVLVVLDSCTDGTAAAAADAGASLLRVDVRNVGRARAAGAQALLERGARWLAFTDADTLVSPGWLVAQLAQQADAVCGCVGVDDWSPHGPHAQLIHEHFLQTYFDRDDHRHVHGANLGVSAQAYVRAGGFSPMATGEDVALVQALEACGARIAWSAAPRVVTSARREARAPEGFAQALLNAVAFRLASLAAPAPAIVATPGGGSHA